MPLTLDTVITRGARVAFTSLDDEMLAIDAQGGFLYSLNETGQRVWDAIAEPATIDDVCRRLAAAYDVDEAICRRDVLALVERLNDAGLVRVAEP
jgi:hypothetical protein